MATSIMVAAPYLALVAMSLIEGAAASGRARRQQGLLLARVRQPVEQPAQAAAAQLPRPPLAARPPLTAASDDAAVALALSAAERDGPEEVDKLEAMVTELVKEKGRAKDGKATPMGPSVKYIKNTIDNTMLPNRKRAYENDQSTLDRLMRDLQGCSGKRRKLLDTADRKKEAYKSGSDAHKLCRNTEAGDFLEKDERCMSSTMEAKTLSAEMVCNEVKEAQKCKYADYTVILKAEEKCRKAQEEVRTAEKYCENCKSRYEATKGKCKHLQSVMDEAACSYAVAMKEACSEYNSCYNDKLKTYEAAEKTVQKNEVARSGEWRALKRMQCLMNAFDNGQVTDVEVDTCKEKTHTPPAITYPSPPSMESCTVPDAYPSTAAYKEKEFALLPPQAKGNPEAGNCFGMAFF